jgi:N-acetylglucosamine kinase-like BadF-type ATPase
VVKLIADSGATKAEWCLLSKNKKKTLFTQGISPYFLNQQQIADIIRKELFPIIRNAEIEEVYYYGTGCASPKNALIVKKAIQSVIKSPKVNVSHDLMAAARSLCQKSKGIACILGTGSGASYYNGKTIAKTSTGLGYVLGDEGSGAYLGRKVIQYYLYNTFDDELRARFDAKFVTSKMEILEQVYKKPLPNRYLASFTLFLAENRGHYMIENIIEDGLNDFFFTHLIKFNEVWKMPVHFVGGVAFGFKDVLAELCDSYGFELGRILKNPMEGLCEYHGR